MRLLRKQRNAYRRSGLLGTIGTAARALVFYATEMAPAQRRSRRREREYEEAFDRKFNVRTGGHVDLVDVDVLPTRNRLFGQAYYATPPASFAQMLSAVPTDFEDFVFVDFGSGLGRVLLLASEYPFRAIRGVEFSPDLHRVACDNIRSYRSQTQKCKDIVSICQDAAEYKIPEEKAVLYLYNPFLAPVMAKVMSNLNESLLKNPREIYLIYYSPEARDTVDGSPVFRLIHQSSSYCVYRSETADCRQQAGNTDANPSLLPTGRQLPK